LDATRRYDALVIGAGMSGLAAGIRLAQFGRRVAVLERHSLWGGLNSFYKLGGRHFDVGLHALTNWAPKGARGRPLTKLLRQLRLRHDDLRLGEQTWSEIAFPGTRLRFSNDHELLRGEIRDAFPREVDGYDRLVERVRATDIAATQGPARSRALVEEHVGDPRLVDMLLLPICYYGSASEDEPDWIQFATLFQALYLEGLCRPEGGIRRLLDLLRGRFLEEGGELRMRTGVRAIRVEGGRAVGVTLDDGTELAAEHVLSSAGWVETLGLVEGADAPRPAPAEHGRLSFLESISVLDRDPRELGIGAATAFYARGERMRYRVPADDVDLDSGVISVPTNFAADEPPPEGLVRLTVLARPDRWMDRPEDEYRRAKEDAARRAIEAAAGCFDGWSSWEDATVFRDTFTPRTIRQFTGHVNGAVYGSPAKRRDGATPIRDLSLIGTDQGYLGVVGALISGITIANRQALTPAASTAPAGGSA